MSYLIAFVSIFLGAIAQYLLKVGTIQLNLIKSFNLVNIVEAMIYNLPLLGGLLCYALSMVFWLFVLSRMELSKAYPLVSLGYVITLFLGFIFLNEPISLSKIIGILFIIIGVIFVTR